MQYVRILHEWRVYLHEIEGQVKIQHVVCYMYLICGTNYPDVQNVVLFSNSSAPVTQHLQIAFGHLLLGLFE